MTGKCLALIVGTVMLMVQTGCAVLQFDNSYYSPRNKERSVRKSTTLIVLHTTEAPSNSALRKLRDLGECNYCVTESGRVYRIIDHRREAYHAGRSMWNGRTNVDSFSVGIEICGYHNKPLTAAQYRAVADLVGELKNIYRIPDQNVVSHAHVAYGTPNKWHKRSHRGRKRCGMLFAQPAIRKRLNLKKRPAFDPDVSAGRLVVGDQYLNQVLYGKALPVVSKIATPGKPPEVGVQLAEESNVISPQHSAWYIARDAYNDPTTIYRFPNGTVKRGNQIADFRLIPTGTKVEVNSPQENHPDTYQVIGVNGRARDIAGDEALSAETIYVYPNGRIYQGSQLNAEKVLKLPYNTKVLVGYKKGGPISASRPASAICGGKWRSKDTFFLIYTELVPGNKVDDSKIPAGTYVFYK
ncbi:MAG: N-acetylmuramoyl-L-alanine amidase [Kiritimatiellae bacterium]|nr:N-acetylmuramoyl-L-alanine amidase [Kiritimatiellia bacterium]